MSETVRVQKVLFLQTSINEIQSLFLQTLYCIFITVEKFF